MDTKFLCVIDVHKICIQSSVAKIQTSEKKIFTERKKQLMVGLHKMVVKQDAYTECDMLVYNVVYIYPETLLYIQFYIPTSLRVILP